MNTFLRYRLPGQSPVRVQGEFESIHSVQGFNGFVASDFEGKAWYGFVDGKAIESSFTPEPVVISHPEYINQGTRFIDALVERGLGKAIFSRVKQGVSIVDADAVFERMMEQYPSAFCYYFSSNVLGTWIGATPERLIELDLTAGSTHALAATKRAQDQTPWGEKEQEEQQLVTDYIEDQLNEVATEIQRSETQELLAGPVKHLVTYFKFQLPQNNLDAYVESIHPTPAVCGVPKDKAIQLIHEFENHKRELYAGVIGVTSQQTTRLFVNLRCGQIVQHKLFPYVGGGLTPKSDINSEWEETENKAKTLLDLL